MRILRDDTYSRRSGGTDPATGQRPGALLFVLMFASLVLLVLSKLNHDVVRELRGQISEFVAPVLSVASVPIQPVRRVSRQVSAYFDLFSELQRLKEENRRLKDWRWRAKDLERRMEKLGALARVVKEPKLEFVSARVIADASGPFVRIALINAGTLNGVKSGFPVINGDGLVGRIIDTGPSASRLLLLSDLNSRVPVLVGAAGHRALLLGDNNPTPRLGFLPQGVRVSPGDDVYTSGVGGLFPRGLRIGSVEGGGGEPRVGLYAHFDDLEYVSVLFFNTPVLERRSLIEQTSGSLMAKKLSKERRARRAIIRK